MRPSLVRALPAVLALAVAAPAAAQHEANASLALSFPQAEFADNTDTGFGFSGHYLYAIHPSRAVAIGGGLSFLNYGNSERRVALSPTIPDIRVDVGTTNNMGFFTGILQVKAPTGSFQPYAFGTGGFGWFSTTTTLKSTLTDESVLSDTNQSDGTWVYGGGGGVQFRVWTGQPDVRDPDAEPARAYVDVGGTWLRGGEVEYLTEGSLVTDDGEFDIDPRIARSEIELAQLTIGVTFEF